MTVPLRLASYRDTPFGPKDIAGAVVCRTEHGNLHAGLLFRDGETVAALHLGWQDQMANTWDWTGVWASPDAPEEKLVAAAGMCRLVWRRFHRHRRFPYALRLGATTFDASGRLVLGPGSRGLTCATLILAVMDSAGISVVAQDSWPVRPAEDRVFIEFVRRFATPDHLLVLEKEAQDGVRRIWPDEVVGACATQKLPVSFAAARAAADEVLEHLRAL